MKKTVVVNGEEHEVAYSAINKKNCHFQCRQLLINAMGVLGFCQCSLFDNVELQFGEDDYLLRCPACLAATGDTTPSEGEV